MKILVINDNFSMTETLQTLLEPLKAEITLTERSRVNKIIGRIQPDLIILDIVNPGPDDWKICRLTRGHFSTPILILAAADNPVTIASALDAGGDDYLVKPVSSGVLIAHINRLIRRTQIGNNFSIPTLQT